MNLGITINQQHKPLIKLPIISKFKTTIIFSMIAFLLAFDQIITYGAAANFGRGGGVGVLIIIVTSLLCLKQRLSQNKLCAILLIALLLIIQIDLKTPLMSQLYIAIIVFFTAYLYLINATLYFNKSHYFTYCLIFIAFVNLISKLGFNLFGFIGNLESNRATGLYAEPSHMVYYVSVAYLFAIKENPKWKELLGLLSGFLLLANFSLTAVMPLLIITWTALMGRKTNVNYKIIFYTLILSVFVLVLFSTNLDYLKERNVFAEEGDQSATVQVILYYYAMLFNIIDKNILFGYGPDQFYEAYSSFSEATFPMFGDLNSTDGSFLLVKMVAEFGSIAAISFIFLIFSILKKNSVPATIIFLQYVFLRGIGVTSIIPLALLFLTYSSNHLRTRY